MEQSRAGLPVKVPVDCGAFHLFAYAGYCLSRVVNAGELDHVASTTLHSYRYAWAERAKTAGFPQRYAQEALGHKSQAVHAAYAKKAMVKVPCLEDWERQMKDKILKMQFNDTSGIETPAKQSSVSPDSSASAIAP